MAKKTLEAGTIRVSKSISMPLDLMNAILEEAEASQKDFSGATIMLLKIGLSMREVQRAREEAELKEIAKRV